MGWVILNIRVKEKSSTHAEKLTVVMQPVVHP